MTHKAFRGPVTAADFSHDDWHQVGLGFLKMPPGYKLLRSRDSGHYLWITDDSRRESSIDVDKWAVWRGAWEDYHERMRNLKAKPYSFW